MKKRVISLILSLIFVLLLVPSVLASESYVIECYDSECNGFCYVYDSPSTTSGKNLGRFDNGTYITYYRTTGSWFYVSGYTTKNKKVYGYIHDFAAVPEAEYPRGHASNVYVIDCYAPDCPGYCYVYDRPSSVDGDNLGRFNNGTEVTYVGKSGLWYKVKGVTTRGKTITGYIHNYSAVPADEYYSEDDSEYWVVDASSRNMKYCYIYDRKSSTNGKNLGSLKNGTVVTLKKYGTQWLYVKATTTKGRTVWGYIHTYCAHPAD